MFPENFDHPTQEFVSSLDQFRAYIDSLFEGKDSILEGKDVQAILNKFEKGRELLVLGRVKASIEAPSLSLSSGYSTLASNRSRGESKHDSQGETKDEDDKSHPSSHSTISTAAPSGSSKPTGFLPSKSATSSAAMATFKGEASFDDLMDPVELEGLIARIKKPPVQSNPLSSSEVAVHIQKGLFISLWSSTISIEDIITQSNGMISILKSFKVDLSTSDKDVSLEELETQYEVKKTNFEEMASSYEEMTSSVSNLFERVTSLEKEIARMKELLKKLESELSSCKAKHFSSQNDLTKYSKTISKSEKELHVALDLVECKKKSAHYDAVKRALDAARAYLMD
ncbi:hypothetical protein RHGRI_029693 [Rhododendron griersonianum]|uniref:Uncharacterized protein n=1 Tax=Rhododendron griersonianum TaxID=479676 RepID=A0AAV6INI5_9ERIC|nr:hypothetical protein RHGRI_029693 [Rhododendron griersonianum]